MPALVDGCLICNGMGQVAAGAACPVCKGTGVTTVDEATKYRQALVDAAVAAATERFAQAGSNAAEGVLRNLAQARADAQETQARAGQVLEALTNARQAAWIAQQAAMRVRGAELIVTRAEAAASRVATIVTAPDPTDPPPGLPLPAGFGGEIFYMDSLLVRQLDALNLNVAGSGGLLVNPMTTLGDLIVGGALGAAGRLPVGSNAQVLTVVGGIPAWASTSASLTNPMTTAQDLIVATTGGVPARLAVGTAGQVLTVSAGGLVVWAASPAGFGNPMTTMGDIIVGTAGGGAARLPIGAPGQVLTAGSTPTWQTNPAGFANPMTGKGDLITSAPGGVPVRLPAGNAQYVLGLAGGTPTWLPQPGGGQVLGPSVAGQIVPVAQQLWDQNWLWLPLTYFGQSGDDMVWANQIATQLFNQGGGKIWMGPFTYSVQTGLVLNESISSSAQQLSIPMSIQGVPNATLIQPTSAFPANTAVVYKHRQRGYGNQNATPADQPVGKLDGIMIDGQFVTAAGVIGLDIGDGWAQDGDVTVSNFTTAGSIGIHHVNNHNFSEKNTIRANILNCSCLLAIDTTTVGSITGSHEYNVYDLKVFANIGQNIVMFLNGAWCSGVPLFRVRGNVQPTTSTALNATTTVAAGSNGGTISNIAAWANPAPGTLDVGSTVGFTTPGWAWVAASGGTQALISYAGTSGGNQLTGCQYVSGSPSGTVATGGAVRQNWSTLSFSGTSSDGNAHIANTTFAWVVESNPTGSNVSAQTIDFTGAAGANPMSGNTGSMIWQFRNATWQPSNPPNAAFQFSGPVRGDSTLNAPSPNVGTPVSGTTYTNNGNDAVVYVSGTVTAVAVDGVVTGLTSGPFMVAANHTIEVTGGAPAWVWTSACPL